MRLVLAFIERQLQVEDQKSKEKATVEADAVVCTLPLGVLQKGGGGPLFEPPLPKHKVDALESMGYGVVRGAPRRQCTETAAACEPALAWYHVVASAHAFASIVWFVARKRL
jgi:hypothetical protein